MADPHAAVPPRRRSGRGDAGRASARMVAIGVAAGLLAGLFGVGGGVVMVPLLVALFAMDQRRASATSLLAIVPIASAAVLGYASTGSVDVGAGALMLLGGIVGGQVGAWLLPRTPIARLQLWFGVLSVVTAVRLILEEGPQDPMESSGALTGVGQALLLVAVGVAAGVLAGLLGVGGGIIMVPALVILAGTDADSARGTSLLVIIATAMTASVANARHGLVSGRVALVAGLAGAPAGLVGAALGQWLPGQVALALFAGLLVWVGARMIRRSRAAARREA